MAGRISLHSTIPLPVEEVFTMKKFNVKQRILSLALSAALVLGCMTGVTLSAKAEEPTGPIISTVADPATVNAWKDHFSMTDTGNAGGVWTDKSVFTSLADYLAATDEAENAAAQAGLAMSDPYHFLVALSAIASAKSIRGYSNIPTDTILILDVSGSMSNSNSDDEMVNAANVAIDTLLKLNEHNRVSVVLYSSNASTMLPLDRYTAGDTYTSTTYVENLEWYPGSGQDRYIAQTTTYQEYLKFSNHNIAIGDKLKNSSGSTVTGSSRNVTGGTYIQSGLNQAMDIFLAADTKIESDKIQAGTIRMPVTVLMSDGDPTYGTTEYANVGDREFGNGSDSSNELGFVTQMSAAYLKAKVEEHYGRSSLFYTLSLGVGTGSVAESVLNPKSSNTTIQGYWDEFLEDGSADWTARSGRNETTYTVERPANDTIPLTGENSYASHKVYVTDYFTASDATALNTAFQSVVDSITLQSMYYPTHVQGNDFDNSGFLEFRDYIGEGMEVKAVKGVQWGDTLYTGKNFAYTVKYNMGTEDEPTVEGDALVWAVMDRLGISDTETARNLIRAAWNAGQLAYNDTNPNNVTYSNYIGWYAAEDGSFLQAWSGDEDFSDKPTGAFQAVKCYFIMGAVGEGHRASDMLYASIQVRTNISTGEQIVYGRLPASLIPLVQYNITIDAADPLDASVVTMDVVQNTPSRLIYEVGLSSDVDLYTLTPGTHEYYTNQWEYELAEGDDPSTHHNTFVSFQPANENERYVYHEDMVVYVKNGDSYERYTGSTAPVSGEYYRAYLVYSATGNGNEATITTRYDKIPVQALTTDNLEQIDSYWVVKKGTVHLYTPRDCVEKTENLTGTLDHSEHSIVHMDPAYHLDAVLGNNGKLAIVITPPKQVFDSEGNDIDGKTVIIGDELTYTITAMNYESSAADIVITDTVPASTVYVNGSATENGVYDAATGKLTWTFADVAAGDSVTVSFKVVVTEAAADAINNTATIQVGNNPAYTTNTTSNPPVGKTASSENYTVDGEVQVGDVITYSIHYHNDNADTAVITITDTIPAGTIYVDGSASYSGTENLALTKAADGTVTGMTWTLSGVPAGTSGSVHFQVCVGPDALNPVKNTATIQIGDNAPIVTTNTVKNEVAYGDLILTKTVTAGNAVGSADKYFTLVLHSGVEGVAPLNGTFTVTGSSKVTSVTFVNAYAYLEIKHGEQITIHDLPAGVTVGVYEQAAGGYTPTYSANYTKVVANETVLLDVVNTYNVNSTSVILEGTKTLTGRDLKGNEFAFLVYENSVVVSTGENAADGTITFRPITYTAAGVYTYTIVEVKGGEEGITYDSTEYTVTVTVTDDGNGNLIASVAYPVGGVAFHNTHTPEPVDVVFEGTKALTGRTLRDNEFSFVVYEGTSIVTTGEAAANGTIVFKPITYTGVGDHVYTIVEVNPGVSGVTYDTARFTVQVSVTLDAQGELVTDVTYPDGAVTFRNTYKPAPVSVTLEGSKILVGRDLKDNEFSFLVYEGSNLVTTGENTASGMILFKPITYTEVGEHTYTVVEVGSNAGGVTYDNTKFTVKVVVTDDGNGQLAAAVTYPDGGVVFHNTYLTDATSVTLTGTKVLTGRPMKDNEFSFIVTDNGGNVVSTGLSKTNGTIIFTPISYTVAGVYTYTIAEVQGNLDGVTYTDVTYTATVTVGDDGAGELVATVSYSGSVEFTNTYVPAPTSITLEGTKVLTGRTMKDNEFSFIVTDNGGNVVSTGLSKADGTIGFTPIGYTEPGTHTYTISEVKGNLGGVTYTEVTYTATVTVTDNHEGQLVATVSYSAPVVFNNTYIVKATSYTPVGTKTLTGRTMGDNEFSFIITENGEVVATGLSKADGTIAFTYISYTAVGTHTYTVSEVKGNLGGVTYTDATFTFTVTVTDDGNGNLIATASYPAPIAFTNTYSTKPVDVQLSATKHLTGKALENNEFTFVLKDSTGNPIETVYNAADGTITFAKLTFSEVGTYTYTIAEVAGTDSRYTYDSHVYTVTIQVQDNGEGELYASVTYFSGTEEIGAIAFSNTYTPSPITLDLNDQLTFNKKVEDLADSNFSAAGFVFEVYDWSGNLVASGTSDANGFIDLEEDLVFTTAGEYRYRVVEKVSTTAGVTYDSTEWIVHVTVAYDNTTGLLSITDVHAHDHDNTGDTDDVIFVNVYDPEDVTLQVTVKKELTGRDMKAGEFTFQLINSNGTPVAQASNDANGNVTFTVAYDKVGVYNYTVREVQGTAGGVTYDQNGYTIKVTVTDEGGKLAADVTSEPVTFRNQYATKAAHITLQAGKELTGRPMEAGEFTFVLAGEGKTYTASNNADGTVIFEELVFTAPGTYTYTITEQAGDLAGVTYSDTSYIATVTVIDDGIGHLIPSVLYTQNGQKVQLPGFTNTYDGESVSVVLKATKALTGRDLEEGEFNFTLTGTDSTLTASNAAAGSIVFDAIEFTEVGEYIYTLTETQGIKGGVTYDETEYAVKIVVSDNYTTGKLEAIVTVDGTPIAADGKVYDLATFHNSYAAESVTVNLEAGKELTGRTMEAGEFTFTLTDANGKVITVANAADGTIDFGTIEYTTTGEYVYTLTEVKGTKGGVTYDETEYTVTVYVIDNLLGQLEASVIVDKTTITASEDGSFDLVTFHNTYAAASVDVTIEALKTITGRTLNDGEFSFALVGEGETYTAENNTTGGISFSLTYTEAGTYTYTLSEVEGTLGGVTYDQTEYTVTVTVTDNLNGQLVAVVAVNDDKALTFENTYSTTSAELTLSADKILVGRPLVNGEFSFLLTDAAGEVSTVTNDAEGNVEFTLTFTEAGVYTYTMSEAAGDVAYIDYDETTYDIVVTVADNGSGALVIESVVINGEDADTNKLEIVFKNTYAEPPAKTGDETNMALHMALILGSVTAMAALLLGKKKQWF